MPEAPMNWHASDGAAPEPPAVELWDVKHGQTVIVRGRRVPLLETHLGDGGRVMLVFDQRLGIDLTADNYERVIAFVSDVIEGCLNYKPRFPRVHTIDAVKAEDSPDE